MSNYPKPDATQLLEIYRKATLIKQNDDYIVKQIMSGRLVCPFYSTRGQEIIPSALSLHLNDNDYVSTIYRGTHDMVAKGFPLPAMWAELAGRVTGTCKGKGGPMHLTCIEKGIMVTTGVVGSSMPIATGLGWAAMLKGKGQVSIANFGDGASNIGAFHESLNMAALWDLPVIFICQNNRFAEHTSFANSTKVERISTRAAGYGMPGVTVNGNDPDEMFGAAKLAVERARAGEGPTLIEALTFRFNGHVLGDAGKYIPKDQVAAAKAADPVPALRARLIAEGIASEADLSAIEADFKQQIEAAAEAAFAAEFPDVAELKRDVFAHEIA
jgi:pyruvate dehydrogenase E1 component alpha subunit